MGLSAVTYDLQNLPISLTRSGTTTTYRYDPACMRISKQVGGGNTEVYLRDGSTTLGVFTVNGSGSLTSWHFNLLAGAQVIGRQPNTGNRRYYHTDLLGSTRSVVQGTTVVESYDFEPLGLLMPGRTLAGSTKEGFTSKERDAETGLDYFGARYYMSALGRWTSVDPVGDVFPSWNLYNYTFNNPVAVTDPDGRCPPDWLCKLIAVDWGQEAAEYYASIVTDRSRNGWQRGAATIGGLFASLWTRDTYRRTAATLVTAGLVSRAISAPPVVELDENTQDGGGQEGSSTKTNSGSGDAAELAPTDGGGLGGSPNPSPNFKPPTNASQNPPSEVPDGWRVREMPPTEQYPDGYWRLEKPMKDGSWQPIDPSTMKPGRREEIHIPLPRKEGG